jgi:hypothetical protein
MVSHSDRLAINPSEGRLYRQSLGRVFSCSVSADPDELPRQFDDAAVGGISAERG